MCHANLCEHANAKAVYILVVAVVVVLKGDQS